MELILFRHGKSEQSWEKRDRDRNLIQRGRDKTRQQAQVLQHELEFNNADMPIKIISSPANRAYETAEIIAEVLEIEEIHTREFIYFGSFDQLEDELYLIRDENPKTQIILTGHQPTLSEWAYALSGLDIDFKTASMLSLSEVEGKRLWQQNWLHL